MDLFNRAVQATLPLAPRALVGHFAHQYIAGETLEEAFETARGLADQGCRSTIDVLGEVITSPRQAERYTEQYLEALDGIAARGLPANISVKLTALGLELDRNRCEQNTRRLVRRAAELDTFLRIDMEDASTTDATFELYRSLRQDHDNLGLVLQARLHRTLGDLEALLESCPSVRVVKGIYRETPEIASRDAEEIRKRFMEIVERLVERGCPVAIATHDEKLIDRSLELIERRGGDPSRREFQMLLGVRPALRQRLVDAGHTLRVYVPFGPDWYTYSLRRLKENPEIARAVMANFFSRR